MEPAPRDIHHCPHILAALADGQVKESILKKYTSVVAWYAHRARDAIQPPAKRRKVSVQIRRLTRLSCATRRLARRVRRVGCR